MKELICIGCPKGCRLEVDVENDYAVKHNQCPIGAEYGRNELKNPQRVLTSTVVIANALYSRCPVKTEQPIPKGKLMDAMAEIAKVRLNAPIKCGDVIIADLCQTGVALVSAKTMEAK